MFDPEHLSILKQGVEVWNKWRRNNDSIRPNLSEAILYGADFLSIDLHGADLRKVDLNSARLNLANLNDADLSCANLGNTSLSQATLRRANLSEAILRKAKLIKGNLAEANLSKTVFFKADLTGANLKEANLTEADLRCANLSDTMLNYADLRGANISKAILVGTHLKRANIAGCRVYGVSAWSVGLKEANQSNLIITPDSKICITVDNLEVAQFIYLLLNNEKVRGVIDTVARKLILGHFGEHKPVLDAIREELRKHDYLPVLFDFDKPATRNVRETVRTLAHLSRFIIADVTDPSSIPLELETIVPELRVPVQPLILTGRKEFSMFQDLREAYHWVLTTHQYADIDDLIASIDDKVIAPAERKAKELEKR